ncbi:MAG TPA: YdcF family protein [Bauldia sp.]|nr:YdcF family protein [Bauldia sp.]
MTDIDVSGDGSAIRPRRRLRLARSLLTVALGSLAAALVIGFLDFARQVNLQTPPPDPHAQGIVVLTGGTARIDEALQLLAERRAARLLISGVNPSVTREAIAATVGGHLRDVLDCCVDLGRAAQDTNGNAVEARDWADRRGFDTLIVVTSGYHMPRSMAELTEAMPGKRLIPFPVVNPDLHLADWWKQGDAFSLLVREYGKYLLAEARRMLSPHGALRAG